MSLRCQLDEWFAGGSPPIDPGRYPHESIYWLLEPLDSAPSIFDARLLRRPTNDLFWRIGSYDRFDLPEDGQEWT